MVTLRLSSEFCANSELTKAYDICATMGKSRNATKGGTDAPKGISFTLSSHADEAGDTGDVVVDFRDEVASLEDALSQMGSSFKIPFCFAWCSRLSS